MATNTTPGVTALGETHLFDDWHAYNAAGWASGETVRRLSEGQA